MKNIFKNLVLLGLLVLSSCSSDDDNNSSNNTGVLTVGDLSVNLTQGYLERYGKVGDAYNIDFTARSSTLFSSEEEAVVYFELFSSQENDLSTGSYELGTYSEAKAFTYTQWGHVIMGEGVTPFDTGIQVKTGVSIRPVSGTFTVNQSGDLYKITFTGKGNADYYTDGELTSSEENIDFSLSYEGEVSRYDISDADDSEFAKNQAKKSRPFKTHTISF